MTDEMDINWFRMCIAINGFRARYGHWPKKMRLPRGALDSLFKESTLARINQKIILQYDDSYFIAEDEKGNSYNFKTEGFLDGTDVDAREWLGVFPDFGSVDVDTQPKQQQAEVDTVKKQKKIGKPKDKPKAKTKSKTKPKTKQTAAKVKRKRNPIVVIFLSEILLMVLSMFGLLIAFALTYQGMCLSIGAPVECSLMEYMLQVVYRVPASLYILAFEYWWIAIPLVILFPLVGLLINSRRAKKE
ncbi:MAG: hypothetical protein JEZ00_00960 [Anaerolineaceae bacterium]|nr:hypothetical protein [Anaerolineaceae bacterium]